jgi:DNA-binding response OmpR family regulator
MTETRKRVLVVDDEAQLRDILSRGLARAGFEVSACADAEAALSALGDGAAPDAIVLDNNLPGMMGIQALPEIAKLTPAPVVMITGQPNPDTERDARLLGAKGMMTKPLNLAELAAALRALLPA